MSPEDAKIIELIMIILVFIIGIIVLAILISFCYCFLCTDYGRNICVNTCRKKSNDKFVPRENPITNEREELEQEQVNEQENEV